MDFLYQLHQQIPLLSQRQSLVVLANKALQLQELLILYQVSVGRNKKKQEEIKVYLHLFLLGQKFYLQFMELELILIAKKL